MAAVAGPAAARAWWEACRPRTLPVGAAPVAVGTALALREGAFHAGAAAASLGVALAFQVAANLANDALDFRRGADGPDRLGPVRAAASGRLSESALLGAALLALGVGAAFGLPLVLRAGWPAAGIGLLAGACALAYSGGRWPLAWRGLGEAAALLFFGTVAAAGSFYVQARELVPAALLAGLPVGILAAAVLAVNNLRDLDGDARVGKRTLVVRLGRKRGARLVQVLLLTPFGVLLAGVAAWGPGAAAPVLLLPRALRLARRVGREPAGAHLNDVLREAARLDLLFSLVLAAGLVAPRIVPGPP